MSFTYDLSTDVGKLRLEISDTDSVYYVFSDEELSYFLTKANDDIQWARVYAYESRCALEIPNSGKEIEVGDIRQSYAASAGKGWCEMAKELRFLLSNGLAPESNYDPFFFAGGVYQTDRDKWEDDISNDVTVERAFWDNYNDMHDSSGLGGGDGK